eukprot:GHRR01022364.1.p2 GENE.GHRR01022364.1~~GHRR01022364.1.p2  ORF type:complete len:113 (-),score=8.98 GHRR01022364.1:625-963(-)
MVLHADNDTFGAYRLSPLLSTLCVLRDVDILTSSLSTGRVSELANTSSSRCCSLARALSYCWAVSLMTGSPTYGLPASWHSMYDAAAMPKIAGAVPSTGIVRTRKLGTICKI